jgi:hypothetical protein
LGNARPNFMCDLSWNICQAPHCALSSTLAGVAGCSSTNKKVRYGPKGEERDSVAALALV